MQSVFVQICYRNVDSRYNKNREVTMCEHVQNGENVRPKTLKKTYLAWTQGLTSFVSAKIKAV